MQLRGRNLFHVIHSGRWARIPRERVRLSAQKGYLLLELAITLMLIAIIGLYTRSVSLQEIDDSVAAATGKYVLAGAAGLETYLLQNTTALTNNEAVNGVANSLQPTLAELQALTVNNIPLLPSTFPTLSPTRQPLQFNIQRIVNAGGVELRATACLNAPLMLRGRFRDDLVTVAVQSMAGRGGRSMLVDNGATIRGPLLTGGLLPNPVSGAPVGIVCSVNLLSDAFYSSFARQQDPRILNFTGVVNASGIVNATGMLGITTLIAGTACVVDGAIAWVQIGATFSPARCTAGRWVATGGGLPISAVGARCLVAGSLAATNTDSALICQGPAGSLTYVDFVSRIGGLVAMESLIVSNDSTVTKPTCALASANTAIYLVPLSDVQNTQVVYRSAIDNGTSWTISIVDSSGVVLEGEALATTYCVY